MTAAIVPAEDLPAILNRIGNGEMAVSIAKQYGCSKQALHQRLKQFPEYKEIREIGMEVQLEEGMANILACEDLDSVRVREVQQRRLEWRAEREFPHRWGAKQEVTHQVGESFAQLLESVAQRKRTTNSIDAAQVPQIIDVTPDKVE